MGSLVVWFIVTTQPRTTVIEGGAGVMERPGRGEAVARLFDEHYRPLCRLAYVIVGDASVSEEIVMDALVRTFSGWGRLRDPGKAHIYLRRAVINLCRSGIRRKQLERRALQRPAAAQTTESQADAHATRDVVVAAVRDLPQRQRACVVLRYFEDLSDADIAEILDCSVGTVKSQLAKARSKLHESLRDEIEGADR